MLNEKLDLKVNEPLLTFDDISFKFNETSLKNEQNPSFKFPISHLFSFMFIILTWVYAADVALNYGGSELVKISRS
jgi:hypothetical protein